MAEEESEECNLQLVRVSVRDWSVEPLVLRGLGESVCLDSVAVGSGAVVRTSEGKLFSVASSSETGGEAARPVALEVPSAVVHMAAGPSFGACVTKEGKLFVWGKLAAGAETLLATTSPSLVVSTEPLSQVAAGTHFVVGVSGRKVLTYGLNTEWGLAEGKDKKALHRTCETVFEAPSEITYLQTYGSLVAIVTSKSDCFVWGGKKKTRLPTQVAVPANTVAVALSSQYMAAVAKGGELFRKKDVWSKGEWSSFGADIKVAGTPRFCGDDTLLVQLRSSGKVAVMHCGKASVESVVLPTIRVSDFSAWTNQSCAMVLCVHNTKNRIFGALYPEPLLRLATAKGFIKWLVSTGCKFNSDVMAFEFALQTVLKLAPARNKDGAMTSTLSANPVTGFVHLLRKYYVAGDATSSLGTRKLLEMLLKAPSTRPQDARSALTLAQGFMQESELTSLWSMENPKGVPALPSSKLPGGGATMEMDEIGALPPRQVAAALTMLRHKQFVSIDPAHIVRFAMISPDPSSFELFPNVAEFVDFGNTLGRWGKEFVVKGSSKAVRGARIRWLYQLLQELEGLRNYDLCFHLSGALLWELMPELAKQAKVDLEAMFATVKRFGDRKFWNGAYLQRLAEDQALIPLLVYHSNLVSGGSGGTDSVIERSGKRYLNISKFRAISDQLLLLRQVVEKCQNQQPSLSADYSNVLDYFQNITVLSDAELTVLRAAIIPVSKFRESAKVTSLEGFSADLISSLSSIDRRLIKWKQLVRLLESDAESVKLRGANFLVCPRDALIDGGLLPAVMRALCTKATDIVWLSPEYWLLRRIVRCVTSKLQFEDVILSVCALLALASESMPQAAEPLLNCFCDFASGKPGVGVVQVVRALLSMQDVARQTLPELEKNYQECETQLQVLKKQDGALSRKQALLTIGTADGFENATVRIVKSKKDTVVDSSKLHKAKLAHFRLQRDSVAAIQDKCREVALLIDFWNLSTLQPPQPRFGHNFQISFKYFLVKHTGSKWGEGAGERFVHHEPDGLSRVEFQERLTLVYEPVFGKDAVVFGSEEGECAIQFYPVRKVEGAAGNVYVTEVTQEDGSKKKCQYDCEQLPSKRRWKVLSAHETALSPTESLVEDLQSRTGVLQDEFGNRKRLSMLVFQAVSPATTWYQILVRSANSASASAELQRAVYDYLQSLRDALAELSAQADEEEETRAHVALCKAFDTMVAMAVPLAGTAVPVVASANKPLFGHKMLHTYAAARRYAPDMDMGVSPGAVRMASRITSPGRDSRASSGSSSSTPVVLLKEKGGEKLSRSSESRETPPLAVQRRDSAAEKLIPQLHARRPSESVPLVSRDRKNSDPPALESPKREASAPATPGKDSLGAAATVRMSRDSASSESPISASPQVRRDPAAAPKPAVGSPGAVSPVAQSPTLRTAAQQKMSEAKPGIMLISSTSNAKEDRNSGRRSGAVPIAGSAVSTTNRYEDSRSGLAQQQQQPKAASPPGKTAAPGVASPGVGSPATGRVVVVDKPLTAEDEKWKLLQQQMAASPKIRKSDKQIEEDRRLQLEEIEMGMDNPLAKPLK